MEYNIKPLLLSILLFSGLSAAQNEPLDNSSLYYITSGGGVMTEKVPALALGIGNRHLWGNHGLDLSLSGQSFYAVLVFDASLNAKAQYLYYLHPSSNHSLYFGGGGGYGLSWNDAVTPGPFGGSSSHRQFLTLDGVIGYEFQRTNDIKPFVQLELSQPVAYFKGKDLGNHTPSATLSIGIGI